MQYIKFQVKTIILQNLLILAKNREEKYAQEIIIKLSKVYKQKSTQINVKSHYLFFNFL